VIDSLCKEDLAVAWLYCDNNAQKEQSVINMMGAVLKRLVGSKIPEDMREAFQKGRRPLLADLIRMMRTAIASLPRAYICIDALDECQPKELLELLGSLRDIVRESPGTRIFFTGRPHVKGAIERYFSKAAAIPISPNQDDIRNFLEMRLDGDDEPEAMNDDLRAEIVKIILDRVSDMYVGVSLLSCILTNDSV